MAAPLLGATITATSVTAVVQSMQPQRAAVAELSMSWWWTSPARRAELPPVW